MPIVHYTNDWGKTPCREQEPSHTTQNWSQVTCAECLRMRGTA